MTPAPVRRGGRLTRRRLVFSEFGRRIGENGGVGVAGTDHGAAGPVFVLGPDRGMTAGTAIVGGIHTPHPSMGAVALPADNLGMTTDVRSVYRTVLEDWLGDPDPLYARMPRLGLFRR